MKGQIFFEIDSYFESKLKTIDKECNQNGVIELSKQELKRIFEQTQSAIRNILDKQTFYVKTSNGKTPPKQIHNNFMSARREAERLTQEYNTDTQVLMIYDENYDIPF